MKKTLYVDTVDGNHFVFPAYQYAEVLPESDPWRLVVKDKDNNEILFMLGAIVWFGENTERR